METIEIRPAAPGDFPAILSIFNEVIANSTAVYSLEPTTIEERIAWADARTRDGFPVIVAVQDGEVVGFASFGTFRGAWPGYRFSVEHSVHVRHDRRRAGIGSRLVRELLALAEAMKMHVMIGGVDAANEASVRMHERLGFERVAHFREIGHKFGRWLDLVFVQKLLP